MTRRQFLKTAVTGSAASFSAFPARCAAPTPASPVARPITRGPKFHRRGYDDKLLFNADGSRFLFLNRWWSDREGKGLSTRMFTANPDGKELFLLDPHGGHGRQVYLMDISSILG